MSKSPVDVALAFVDRINCHDLEGLAALMSEDHCFIDGLGQIVRGRSRMEEGWRSYFRWFPDYRINVDDTFSSGNKVALFGTAEGTYSMNCEQPLEKHWKIPASWRALIRGGHVFEWRVYADNEPVWKIMGVNRY